jgi:hypothetical protein
MQATNSVTAVPADATVLWKMRRSLRYAALIAPLSVVGLVATAAGNERAWRWEHRAAVALGNATPANSAERPSRSRLAANQVMGTLLGLVTWLLLAIVALLIARGLFYGFVDAGPYDDSWGGPSKAGAWLVHFLVSIPFAALALVLASRVGRLHHIVAQSAYGQSRPWWAIPVAIVSCLGAAIFLMAWLQQV